MLKFTYFTFFSKFLALKSTKISKEIDVCASFLTKLSLFSNLSVNLLFFSSFVFLIGCGDDRWDPEVLNKTAPMNPARMQKIDLNGSVEMEMIWAAGGSFIMGSPDSEVGRQDGRENQHEVVFSEGFFLGKYEVTQLQYRAVMGGAKSKYNADPSHFKGLTVRSKKYPGLMPRFLLIV